MLEKNFQKIGARVLVTEDERVSLDVRRDKYGEFFHLVTAPERRLQVSNVQKGNQGHLIIQSQNTDGSYSKYLLGHDERHLYVAAIPENSPVSTVRDAMEALKPHVVRTAQIGVRKKKVNKRKNEGFLRQGEWFFIPTTVNAEESLIFKNEPIRRGRGSPHICGEIYRTGGISVKVCREYPNGLTEEEYNVIPEETRNKSSWTNMVRDAEVYARGTIKHRDHKTIHLPSWHKVVMNTETQTRGMASMAFLD